MPRNIMLALVFIVTLWAAPMAAGAAPIRIMAMPATSGSEVLELQADELVTMTAIPFRLLINDAAGRPLLGARVRCDLTMPSMSMPENRPKITEHEGAYTGEMILTCIMGEWRATCVAEDGQGARRTMTFDLGTARMK